MGWIWDDWAWAQPSRGSEEFEIFFGDAAIGTHPGFWHVFPAGPGLNAVIGPTIGFVVDQAADNTNVFFVLSFHGVQRDSDGANIRSN